MTSCATEGISDALRLNAEIARAAISENEALRRQVARLTNELDRARRRIVDLESALRPFACYKVGSDRSNNTRLIGDVYAHDFRKAHSIYHEVDK